MELTWAQTIGDGAPATDGGLEGELVAAAGSGDRDAFTALVRLHQHRVFRLSGRFFRRREDVEDAAQETFLTVWRRLSTFRGTAPFEHWLTRVCLNCCYRKLRAQRHEKTEDVELDLDQRSGTSVDPTVAVDVGRLLARLKPQDRFILLLMDGEGWSVAEVAERVGWTQTNVKVRAFRARHRLRRLLEERP